LQETRHRFFRAAWWATNALLAVSILAVIYSGGWEYSVRQYLRGFSDALVPSSLGTEEKVAAILDWMRNGTPRPPAVHLEQLGLRDPQTTLNYKQLLQVCGTATNAFLNLAQSSGLSARRLLLLTPERTVKHVVAEVLIEDRWIVVDPAYRVILRDAEGHMLTQRDLQKPAVLAEATRALPNYPKEYTYETFTHVRLARLPLNTLHLHQFLDGHLPGWDESVAWGLVLERESFLKLVLFTTTTFFLLLLRMVLGWYADRRLHVKRFQLRENMLRAATAFLKTPEIKQ
jgi:hypothetical protein